ncbi:Copper transporter 5 [Morus notabilis]|uniref:Copper transport protein n=1 Tax=Morus notabilis TaxID=981085 RepID=W9QK89_9ROSA|nr:copper transporter 5.1 [Morus notabilis]EXB38971.1 Copper transporter 5 [Morus notabilis]
MMHMTLYWSKAVTLLIDSWKTDSWTSYLLTLLACFLVSAFHQYLEDRRIRFKASLAADRSPPSIDAPLLFKLGGRRGFGPARIASAVMFGINSAIGYLLMLAVMSFNGGVLVAVVLGLSVGYFFFRAADEEIVIVDNPCACA